MGSEGAALETPDSVFAARLAREYAGQTPLAAVRFTTGSQHFVFDVSFADRAPVVVRLSRPADRGLAVGASRLSRQLRPLGVPLPAVLFEDLDAPQPYQVLERLPGNDLGQVITQLSPAQYRLIGGEVARAQAIVAKTRTAGRYGFVADPELAPYGRWSEVLEAGLERSRLRIARAGIYDPALVGAMAEVLAGLKDEADAQPPTPFLHDTTVKNVIIRDDGAFSGIVDVDDLCFGDPRFVVALTLAALTEFGGPPDYAMSWLRTSGFSDDRLFRLYVALHLLDFMSEQGQVFNGNERQSSRAEQQRLQALFVDALQRVAG